MVLVFCYFVRYKTPYHTHFCSPIPRRKLFIKNKVWELYLSYPVSWASRIAFGTDKTIATHTKEYIETLQT